MMTVFLRQYLLDLVQKLHLFQYGIYIYLFIWPIILEPVFLAVFVLPWLFCFPLFFDAQIKSSVANFIVFCTMTVIIRFKGWRSALIWGNSITNDQCKNFSRFYTQSPNFKEPKVKHKIKIKSPYSKVQTQFTFSVCYQNALCVSLRSNILFQCSFFLHKIFG